MNSVFRNTHGGFAGTESSTLELPTYAPNQFSLFVKAIITKHSIILLCYSSGDRVAVALCVVHRRLSARPTPQMQCHFYHALRIEGRYDSIFARK